MVDLQIVRYRAGVIAGMRGAITGFAPLRGIIMAVRTISAA